MSPLRFAPDCSAISGTLTAMVVNVGLLQDRLRELGKAAAGADRDARLLHVRDKLRHLREQCTYVDGLARVIEKCLGGEVSGEPGTGSGATAGPESPRTVEEYHPGGGTAR